MPVNLGQSLLVAHFADCEKELLAKHAKSSHLSHRTVKGQAREVFIKEFLRDHLSEKVGIGSGEVIDAQSMGGDERNQHDIIIFKREYPRLHFAKDVETLLAESVIATIEVKSLLNKAELAAAAEAAMHVKALSVSHCSVMTMGPSPPAILSYVVAYAGAKKAMTIHGWLHAIYEEKGLGPAEWPMDFQGRTKTAAPGLDGVFMLGTGCVLYDNTPLITVQDVERKQKPTGQWSVNEVPERSLLYLFLLLTHAVSGFSMSLLDLNPYLRGLPISGVLMP